MSFGMWVMAIGWALICPGAGHAAAGRPRSAIAWAALGLAAMLAVPFTVAAAAAAVVVHFAAGVEGCIWLRRARPAQLAWTRPAIAVTVIAVAGAAYATTFLKPYSIPSTAMCPALEIGDWVGAERLTLAWRPPERGEIVVFKHPCQPSVSYIKRVIAIANDTIEIRCNVVYVNGAAIPSELLEGGETCRYRDRDEYRGSDEWFERTCSRYRETLGGRTYDVLHHAERPERDELRKAGTLESGDSKDYPMLGEPLRSCANVAPVEGRPSTEQAPGSIVVTKQGAKPCEPQAHFVVPPDSVFVLGDNRDNSNDSRFWGVVPVSHVVGRVVGVYLPLGRAGGR